MIGTIGVKITVVRKRDWTHYKHSSDSWGSTAKIGGQETSG